LMFIFLGLLISTLTARTKTALMTALLTWGALVLVLPNATVVAAQIIRPTSSYNQLNARLRAAHQEIFQAELRSHPEIHSIFESPNVKARLLESYDMDQALTDDYLTQLWAQTAEAKRLAILLPAGALEFGASDMSGTGVGNFKLYLDFLRAGGDRVRNALRQQLDLPAAEGGQLIGQTIEEVSRDRRPWQPLKASLQWALSSFISLGVWTVGLSATSLLRFERYDVR
jgi:hypothetical protein